ncbi:MAG: amino acid ABC transporter ATP-binding protein [Myxococcales bacterium]|nr:amino acid ABC transporter ATP-binding protein [Myxococcales bacterium]HRC55215.1 amino acid ABC transporter ATP-binding protein [Kofleriaceae bacterium]
MISIRGLCKRHGQRAVLDDITATVERGEIVAIVGPSGGGKSTLLRCLNALDDFDAGEIDIAGFSLRPAPTPALRKQHRRLRAAVGLVFQQFHLFPHLSAADNIALAPRLVRGAGRAEARRRAAELLAQVGLGDRGDAFAHQLSGGQQQRVAIARALAGAPEVLLFDEPTSALDPEMRDEVMQVIREVAGGGITMLVVTHEMQLVANVATRIWVLDGGHLVEQGPASEVLAQPKSSVGRDFFARIRAPEPSPGSK